MIKDFNDIEEIIYNALYNSDLRKNYFIVQGANQARSGSSNVIEIYTNMVSVNTHTYDANMMNDVITIVVRTGNVGVSSYRDAKKQIKETALKIVHILRNSNDMTVEYNGILHDIRKHVQMDNLQLEYEDFVIKYGALHLAVPTLDYFYKQEVPTAQNVSLEVDGIFRERENERQSKE